MAVTNVFTPRTKIRSAETNANNNQITEGNAITQMTASTVSMNGNTGYYRNSAVAHGMTTIVPTDVYGSFGIASGTDGGLEIIGLSDTDNRAFKIKGYIGSADPTDSLEAIQIVGAKKDGTGIQALGTNETILGIYNGAGNQEISITGNGNFNMWSDNQLVCYANDNISYNTVFTHTDNNLWFNAGTNGQVQVFGKMPRDNNGSATYIDSFIQRGWFYVVGNGTDTLSSGAGTIDFAKQFSSANYTVTLTPCGVKATASGAPTNENDFDIAGVIVTEFAISAHSHAKGSFKYRATTVNGSNTNANYNYGFTYIAIGPI